MDILKTATDWAKAETLSSSFFIGFGILFVLAGVEFWQLGKTDMSRAYIIPSLVAGAVLVILGLGLVFPNLARISGFAEAFNSDAPAFVTSEIARVDKTMNDYRVAVFTVMPLIIALSAFLVMFLDSPVWRAALILTIAMMAVIMLVDTNANARLKAYKEQLLRWEQPE